MSRGAGPRAPSSPPRLCPNVFGDERGSVRTASEARRRQRVSTVTSTERTDGSTPIRVAVADDEETVVDVPGRWSVPIRPFASSVRRTPPAKPRLALISPPLPRRDERAARVARAILDSEITAEFDPIVDLGTGRTIGFDVRSRVTTLPHRSYDTWIADAEAADLLLDFELAAFRAAIQALREIPTGSFLEFEVTPATACTSRFRRAIGRPIADRIVLGYSPLVVSVDG